MHRESPTDATVTTHSSIITNVTVVPEVSAETIKRLSEYKNDIYIYIYILKASKGHVKYSIIYIFDQHIELPHSPKISRNSHINRRKKEKKLPTTAMSPVRTITNLASPAI
jgi:hypothetical protein